MTRSLTRTIALLLALTGPAILAGCPGPSQPTGTTGALVPGPGERVIRGRVSADGLDASAGVISGGSGNVIAPGALNRRVLQSSGMKGGKVRCTSSLDTKEVDVREDGSFEASVKAGAEYTLEATVPDGRGGVLRSVTRLNVPVAQDPQVADIVSLVTRRTGSIQGLVELKDAKAGDTVEGADVFLAGGTSVVGKVGEKGRFALTNVAEGTWNVVIMKPGYKRQVVQNVEVKSGRAQLLDATIVLEREVNDVKAGLRGKVTDSNGNAVVGANVSAYPVDRAAIVNVEGGLDNFTAVTDEAGEFEMLNLPPTAYQLQVSRPFYQLPPRQTVTVEANRTTDVGTVKMVSTVAYFGRISAQVVDEQGAPLDGAVAQLDPPVTDQQFSDAKGNFTLDRVMPGEYNLSIAAGGHTTVIIPIRVENQQGFHAQISQPVSLVENQTGRELIRFPDDGAIKRFSFVATEGDTVSGWNAGPDGQLDGRFVMELSLPAETQIRSMTIYTVDNSDKPAWGQVWDTVETRWFVLGVVHGEKVLTSSGHVPSLGTFSGDVSFDLYGSDSGFYKPGMKFLAEVFLGDGRRLSGFTTITGKPAQ